MEHKYSQSWDIKGYKIIECETCGFKHIYPIPGKEELDTFYREKYFADIKPFNYEQVDSDYIKSRMEWANRHKEFIDIFNKVNEFKKTEEINMLDVGCGNNLLGVHFKQKGWNVYPVEPNKDAGEHLRKFGLEVCNDYIENIDRFGFKNISFVNVHLVMEHLPYPVEFLQKVYQLMEPGGVIRICVPNDFSEGQMAYKEYFQVEANWVCLPDHINYFTFDSLSNLLSGVGFKEVYRIANFPLEMLLMGGINYYASEEDNQKVGPFVHRFEQALITTGREHVLKKFYESIAQAGFGRAIYMYAIKE